MKEVGYVLEKAKGQEDGQTNEERSTGFPDRFPCRDSGYNYLVSSWPPYIGGHE